jgi:hypothetical protein
MRAAITVLVVLLVAGVATAATSRPTLQLAPSGELVVRGTGFAQYERLRVTAFVRGGPLVRRVTASRLGTFSLRFDANRDGCTGGHLVQAFGPKSGLVRLKLSLRECPELVIP